MASTFGTPIRTKADAAMFAAAIAALVASLPIRPRTTAFGTVGNVTILGFAVLAWTLVVIVVAVRLWSSTAPRSTLRLCLVLSVLGCLGVQLTSNASLVPLGPAFTGVPSQGGPMGVVLGGWLVVEAVAAMLVVELPSVGATTAERRNVRRAAIALGAAGPVITVAFLAWSDADQHPYAILRGAVLVCTPVAAFAVWAGWRAWFPSTEFVSRVAQIVVPVVVVLSTGVILTFAINPGVREIAIVPLGAAVLPVAAAAIATRDYVVNSQTRKLAVILDSHASPAELEHVLRSALGDRELRLALRVQRSDRFVGSSGRELVTEGLSTDEAVPVELNGAVIAMIVWSRAATRPSRRRAALIGVATLAIEKAQLQATVLAQMNDVADSRRRLVDATDRARRSVERDLHDGAQQRLAALTLSLRLAASTASSPEAAELARATAAELLGAVGELQELARGIHPAVLSDSGIRAAVESLAERSPYPVEADVPGGRYDPTIELTAYLVIAEALANISKHAGASHATVTAVDDGMFLRIDIGDDGDGGADPGAGTGLQGLVDRVEAVGGQLSVTSPVGEGTAISALLPISLDGDGAVAR